MQCSKRWDKNKFTRVLWSGGGRTGDEAESTLRAAGGGGVARCQRGGERGKRESIMVWAKGRSLCWRLSNSVSPWEV